MDECDNNSFVPCLDHLIKHSVASKHNEFSEAGIVLFRDHPAAVRKLA